LTGRSRWSDDFFIAAVTDAWMFSLKHCLDYPDLTVGQLCPIYAYRRYPRADIRQRENMKADVH
jgi:hypothetical protein